MLILRRLAAVSAAVAIAMVATGTIASGGASATPVPRAATAATSQFSAVGPVRLADTRATACGCTRLDDHTIRIIVAGRRGIGGAISAAAVTVTATGASVAGFATAYPAGLARPDTSTLNLPAGADTSNSTIKFNCLRWYWQSGP